MLRRILLSLAVALAAVTAPATVASAGDGVVCTTDPVTGECTISVGGEDEDGGDGGGGGGGGARVCTDWDGTEVECYNETFGWWVQRYECWAKLLDPQPPKDHLLWEGNTDGAIYMCTMASWIPGTGGGPVWLPEPPGGGPDPAVLADQAIESMNLRAGEIAVNPQVGAQDMTIVGVPTWLWVADPGESTTGPITRSASAGGVTVTATGRLDRVVWSMGDGTTVTCAGGGTPYLAGHGDAPSPDCGHTYRRSSAHRPDEEYPLSATSYWTVEWAGGGQTGSVDLELTRATTVRVGEVQVLVGR